MPKAKCATAARVADDVSRRVAGTALVVELQVIAKINWDIVQVK